jgi:Holliday junction resolvase RusA-like endonuclease
VLPFELFVFATPVSRQTRRKTKRRDWRETIREEALMVRVAGGAAVTEPIRVRIGYYFRGGSLDVDNILKAILDGLQGVVYTDDNLIMDLIVSKRSLDEFVRVGVSAAFARALATGADFVHIVVDRPSEIEVLR